MGWKRIPVWASLQRREPACPPYTHCTLYFTTFPLFYFCTFAFLTFVLLYFHGIEEDHSQDLLYWDSLCYESLPIPCRKHCDSSTDLDHCPYTPAASLRGRNFVHGHWSMPSHWSRDADYLCLRVPNTKYSDSFTEPSLEEIVPYLWFNCFAVYLRDPDIYWWWENRLDIGNAENAETSHILLIWFPMACHSIFTRLRL